MYERENARRLIILGIGVVAVVVIVGAIFFFVRGRGNSNNTAAGSGTPTAIPLVSVVVSTVPIPQATNLNVSQVPTYFGLEAVPGAVAPPDAYTSLSQVQSLIASAPQGAVTTTQTIFQKSVIVPGMFSTFGQFKTGPTASSVIPYGYEADAVAFDPLDSVENSITAGDDIDIIGSLKAPTTPCGQTVGNPTCGMHIEAQTQFVLTDVRVLSVNVPPPVTTGSAPVPTAVPAAGVATATPATTPTATPIPAAGGGTLLLLLRYQQALELQHLKDFGWQLSAVLRSSKQQTTLHLKTLPVTDRWFFSKTQTPFKANPGY
jgi:Flp pilus assembly protein CpaB